MNCGYKKMEPNSETDTLYLDTEISPLISSWFLMCKIKVYSCVKHLWTSKFHSF
jgi:hypothetical protein